MTTYYNKYRIDWGAFSCVGAYEKGSPVFLLFATRLHSFWSNFAFVNINKTTKYIYCYGKM